MDAHQPEGVRTVRAPIVVWPEPDVSIIVGFLFVIPAQRVAAGFGGGVVEEDPREVAPSRLNACRGRAGAWLGTTNTSKPASRIARIAALYQNNAQDLPKSVPQERAARGRRTGISRLSA
jgi:hypothetical protein